MIRRGLGGTILAAVLTMGCGGTRPDFVGSGADGLAPCPSSPNCVSSLATDQSHRVDVLRYEGPPEKAMEQLAEVVVSMERTEIIKRSDRYLYAEFTTGFWRFIDDVEFLFGTSPGVIHVRSSSRLGHSDMGVNRRRVEKILELFEKKRKEN